MADSKTPRDSEPATPRRDNPLESLLASVDNFVGQISALSAEAAPKGESQVLIQSTGESLVGQTGKLTAFIRETADRLPGAQRIELDRFLRVQDGEALAGRGVEVTRGLLAGGILGKLVHWIAQHLQQLKKILKEILHFIFKLLNIPYPDWLDRILEILDELLNLLLSLLAEVFGIDFGVVSRQLSNREVDFLHEMAAFEVMRSAQAGRRPSSSDDV
jgi:hypothetical protein